MSTKKCANPRFGRVAPLVRPGRIGRSPLVRFSRFCVGEFDAFDPTRGQDLVLDDPLAELMANVQVLSAQGIQQLTGDEFACSVPDSLAGIKVGDQVRVTRNANEYALYNVVMKRVADNPNRVRMGLQARMRLGTSDEFVASLRRPVIAPVNVTDAQAQAIGEFVERLVDDAQNTGLLVTAPHAGGFEFNSDRQAEAVTTALDCSSWICKGWKKGGGAYSRWHITSTKISPRSFPALGFIANRGFTYAVSFHGMAASGVLVGGAAPMELKLLARQAILAELSDPDINVMIAQPGDNNAGDSPKNFVNWITASGENGLQIEQGPKVRQDHWQEVANGIISLFAQLL